MSLNDIIHFIVNIIVKQITFGAVHILRHALGDRGGLTKCESFVTRGGGLKIKCVVTHTLIFSCI